METCAHLFCCDTFVGWLVGFYDISIYIGYLMPNPFLFK